MIFVPADHDYLVVPGLPGSTGLDDTVAAGEREIYFLLLIMNSFYMMRLYSVHILICFLTLLLSHRTFQSPVLLSSVGDKYIV